MKKVDKPIRLYVLTIFVVLAYGILPFVSTMPFGRGFLLFGPWTLPFNGSIYVLYGADGEAPLILILVSLFLCAFSAAFAVLTFYGINFARIATLVLISLNVLWWTMLAIMVIVEGDLKAGETIRVAMEPLPPFLWLGFIWWNYTRADVVDYCVQESAA